MPQGSIIMQEFFKSYGTYFFDVLMFIMVFAWCFCGSGGTRHDKNKWLRYGAPVALGLFVVLVVHGFGAFDRYLERNKCADLPIGVGVMIEDRCYKRVDGPVYVSADSTVYKESNVHD